ncbi:MAG: hypothetical protein ACI9U2_002477 [Bradymonadia bacterium]
MIDFGDEEQVMSSDSILDMMIGDDKTRQVEQKTRAVTAQRLTGDLEKERHAKRVAAAQEEMREAHMRSVSKAANAPVELAGLRVGMRFAMRGCAEQINGEWVVQRIDPGPAGDESRRLYAQRIDGGPGFLPFTERKALDAIHAGLLVR